MKESGKTLTVIVDSKTVFKGRVTDSLRDLLKTIGFAMKHAIILPGKGAEMYLDIERRVTTPRAVKREDVLRMLEGHKPATDDKELIAWKKFLRLMGTKVKRFDKNRKRLRWDEVLQMFDAARLAHGELGSLDIGKVRRSFEEELTKFHAFVEGMPGSHINTLVQHAYKDSLKKFAPKKRKPEEEKKRRKLTLDFLSLDCLMQNGWQLEDSAGPAHRPVGEHELGLEGGWDDRELPVGFTEGGENETTAETAKGESLGWLASDGGSREVSRGEGWRRICGTLSVQEEKLARLMCTGDKHSTTKLMEALELTDYQLRRLKKRLTAKLKQQAAKYHIRLK